MSQRTLLQKAIRIHEREIGRDFVTVDDVLLRKLGELPDSSASLQTARRFIVNAFAQKRVRESECLCVLNDSVTIRHNSQHLIVRFTDIRLESRNVFPSVRCGDIILDHSPVQPAKSSAVEESGASATMVPRPCHGFSLTENILSIYKRFVSKNPVSFHPQSYSQFRLCGLAMLGNGGVSGTFCHPL